MKKKLVCGVGINDADYPIDIRDVWYECGKKKQKVLWVCPFYARWKSMLKRCYSEKVQEKYPTYKGCSVCEQWLTFSNFKAWMEKQDWEGKDLDKDILFKGDRVYSAETCVFVDQRVNLFLTDCASSRGEYIIGVCWDRSKNKFKAACRDGSGIQKHLGYFDTESEAHKAWLDFKLKLAHKLASEQTDPRIAKALIERYKNYEV